MAGMGRGGGRVDKCYKLSNRGGCGGGVAGDGGRIDPQFFILFPELGVDPILISSQGLYLSLV